MASMLLSLMTMLKAGCSYLHRSLHIDFENQHFISGSDLDWSSSPSSNKLGVCVFVFFSSPSRCVFHCMSENDAPYDANMPVDFDNLDCQKVTEIHVKTKLAVKPFV